MATRMRYSNEFKVRVALEAIREELTPAMDNRVIERLWRSLKYECVYLRAIETGSEAKKEIGKWLAYYNTERPNSTHGILTPSEAYGRKTEPTKLAA